ncbi:MFS transporter [Roseateles toxinivorans]|uniref:Putative MFS family arabinose efflux permease n=1 Tax=Roseateles toxinivorans TaxID=270368 RepID=A0A4R6QFI7_9BURK|nr:MFS transporter [Roseateles toxinivorans]TDP61245.1 putative MFS family arabinose efflux permease [Roseateles toxinivorans]
MPAQTETAVLPLPSGAAAKAPVASWASLLVLVALGLYTYMDRQIFSLQAEPLRQALGLSDFQFGLLQGVSVALFAALVGYPVAWLSDRFDRRTVLAGCIATWSLAVAACGLTRDFNELFVASSLVGAAEAGLLPIAYALIPELFRGAQRQLANSLFVVTGRLVVGLVIALCGWVIHAIDLWRPLLPEALQALPTWRLAFFATALPGVLFVPMILLLPINKRKLPLPELGAPVATPPGQTSVWAFLRGHRITFVTFMLSVGLLVFGFGATGAFIPVVAMRQMGVTPLDLGNAMGIATFVSAAVGLMIANVGMKWMLLRVGPLLAVRVLALAALISGVFSATIYFAKTPVQLFTLMALQQTFLMAGTMAFPTALQEMTPTLLRARIISLVIMFNMVLGSLSPAIVGAISDALKPRPDGLMLAMTATSSIALLLAALLMAVCGRGYVRTTQAARAAEGN